MARSYRVMREPAGIEKCHYGPVATKPRNTLVMDGSAVSRTTYARLFAVIGTTHGAGDGSTTFNLPNAQDRVTVGAGNNYVDGATGGADSQPTNGHTLTSGEMPTHNHTVRGSPHYGHSNNVYPGGRGETDPVNFSQKVLNAGGDLSHNHGNVDVRQPYNAAIKVITI